MFLPEPTPKGSHIKWAWLDHWAGGISSEVIHVHLNFVFFTNTVHVSSGLSFCTSTKNYYFGVFQFCAAEINHFVSTVKRSKDLGPRQDRDWVTGYLSSHATISQVHKTVTTASGTGHIFLQLTPSNVAKLAWPRWREVAAQHSMTSNGGSCYSFMYSWWWLWLTPETCRVNLKNDK